MTAAAPELMTWRGFESNVIDAARKTGWKVAHFRPAMTTKGWRTPVQGDGVGFPDLVMVHPRFGGIAAELKTGKSKVSPAQEAWLALFAGAGFRTFVWRPADWHSGAIQQELLR